MNISIPQLFVLLRDHWQQLQELSPQLAEDFRAKVLIPQFGPEFEYSTFIHEDHTLVATDGSVRKETSLTTPTGSACAYSINQNSRLNVRESLPYEIGFSNIHGAETLALLLAHKTAVQNSFAKIHILSDSLNCSQRYKLLEAGGWHPELISQESYCKEEEQLWQLIAIEARKLESVHISHIRSHVEDE